MVASLFGFVTSWVGWLIILAGLYVVYLIVRALVELVSWFIDEFVVEPREQQRRQENRRRT